MAQAKKKTATRTTKKTTKSCQSRKKACTRTAKKQGVSSQEKMHVYIVTAMAMIAGILLCADAAILMVI